MTRREIPLAAVQQVMKNPDQIVPEHGGLVARQGRVTLGGRRFLVRVVVAERSAETVVVTVY